LERSINKEIQYIHNNIEIKMTDNTNNNCDSDDAEKMRLAFEQFMLSGGGKNNKKNNSQSESSNTEASTPQSASNKSKKKKKKKRHSSTASGATPTKVVSTPPPPVSATKEPSLSSSSQKSTTTNPKIKKRYYQLFRSYTDKIKHTWMDIDEQLLSVLQNIGSIRGRLPHEWKMLSQTSRRYHHHQEEEVGTFESPEEAEEFDNDNGEGWKSHGYQDHTKGSSPQYNISHYLKIDDIQLALSNDLEQHEKMFIGLRSLMANMAECHDALGRIVDSLFQFHFEVEEDYNTTTESEKILEHIVTCVTESYQMLSMELYRKQNLIALVIESTKDEILGVNVELGKGPDVIGTKSQILVRECCKEWKRSSGDEELLLNVMKLGES